MVLDVELRRRVRGQSLTEQREDHVQDHQRQADPARRGAERKPYQ